MTPLQIAHAILAEDPRGRPEADRIVPLAQEVVRLTDCYGKLVEVFTVLRGFNGVASGKCPLCVHLNEKLLRRCQMHEDISHMQLEIDVLRQMVADKSNGS